MLVIVISTSLLAQGQEKGETITESIKVSGVCSDCKARIEKAAYLPGVRRAEWDKNTKELVVSYRTSKVSLKQIKENIARSGHDAGEVEAPAEAYNKLPSCCAYKEVDDH